MIAPSCNNLPLRSVVISMTTKLGGPATFSPKATCCGVRCEGALGGQGGSLLLLRLHRDKTLSLVFWEDFFGSTPCGRVRKLYFCEDYWYVIDIHAGTYAFRFRFRFFLQFFFFHFVFWEVRNCFLFIFIRFLILLLSTNGIVNSWGPLVYRLI